MKRPTFILSGAIFFVIAIGQGGLALAGSSEQGDFAAFWKKFSSAVIAGQKTTASELTNFPLSMPYSVKAVKNKSDFVGRYNEIFQGEANAAQCFANTQPRKTSDRQYEVYCPFKSSPKDKENAPIRYLFERTKTGWKFTGLDNINE